MQTPSLPRASPGGELIGDTPSVIDGARALGCRPCGVQAAGAGPARQCNAPNGPQAVSELRASRPVPSFSRQTPLPHDPSPRLGFSGDPGWPGEGSGRSVALGSGHPLWVLPRGPLANGLSVSLLPAAYSTPGTSPANRSFVGLGPRDPAGIYQAQVGAERPAGAGEGGPGHRGPPGRTGRGRPAGCPAAIPPTSPPHPSRAQSCLQLPTGDAQGPSVQLGRLRLAEARDLPRITQHAARACTPPVSTPSVPPAGETVGMEWGAGGGGLREARAGGRAP